MTDPCYSNGDTLLPLDEALQQLLSRAKSIRDSDSVPLLDCYGRVLSEDVHSTIDVPPWDNSSMDGYAVRSDDCAVDGECVFPVSQRIAAGQVGEPLAPGTAARIFTGAPMPDGADAVVIQEDCVLDDGKIRFQGPIKSACNVRKSGADIRQGALVLSKGTRLGAVDVSLAASIGLQELPVTRRPRVAILTTGDELAEPGQALGHGQIFNSNRYLLHGLLQALGCEISEVRSVADEFEVTRKALTEAAEADLIISTGGVSVGEEDHVRQALEKDGELSMWRIRIKPGKPLVFGRMGDADFIGLPGNPVSVLVTFLLFARPFLLRRLGVQDVGARRFKVVSGFVHGDPGNRREFFRARLSDNNADLPIATLYPDQSSGVLSSAAWAEGLLDIPEGVTFSPGDMIDYLPLSQLLY